MVIFKKVRWKNLLSTGNIFTEVNLVDSPSTLIVGENGAGKSTFIEALFYAMFGRPFRKINKPQLVNSINQKNMLVELEFSIGAKDYLIRRGMKPNIFEIYLDGNLINQDAAIRDYQEYLEKSIFKLNHKSASQIIILGSRSFIPFMQLPAQHRREVIEDLLDLQIFSVMNTLLKQKVVDNKNELKDIKYSADLVQEKIRLQKEYIKSITENHQAQIDENVKKIHELNDSVIEYTNNITLKKEQITEFLATISDNNLVKTKLQELMSLETDIMNKMKRINKDLEFYHDNDQCPTCKQGLDHIFKAETLNKKNNQLDETNNLLEQIQIKHMQYSNRMDEIIRITANISELYSEISSIESMIKSALDFRSKIENEITRLSETHRAKTEDTEKLEQLKKELKICVESHQNLLNRKSILDVVAVLLKDGGIKSKIIKQYIPIMNKLINKYLAAMELTCSFELDENFNEIVRSRHRDEFSYASFSEGEKARIDLAILFAWRAISKLRNSNATNLLILDETFDGSLDSTGTEELLKIISSITADSNVFVISHKPDTMVDKFSNVIRFEKSKNFSRIKEST